MSRSLPTLARLPLALACTAAALTLAAPARAAPGLGEEVYGATVERHELELEARYGQLSGGADGGDDNARLEAAYGVTKNLKLATVVEFERAGGGLRQATHLGFEAVYYLGRVGGIDVAGYQEFEIGLNGNPNSSETKLLLEKRQGPLDLRFNLIGEKPFDRREPLALRYAASADVAVARRLRLGVTGFGDLGTFSRFGPAADHYLGPVAKLRLPLPDREGDGDGDGDGDRGVRIEAGYLFGIGATTASAHGQFRLNLEVEL